jgi:hypothetical protein
MRARGVQHVLGKIDANDVTSRQCFQQIGGQPAGSTSCVEKFFVAAQAQP